MVIDFYQNQKSDCSINEQCRDMHPTPAGHLFSPALCYTMCKRNFSLNLVIRYILTPEQTIWHWPRQSHHWTELSLKRLCTFTCCITLYIEELIFWGKMISRYAHFYIFFKRDGIVFHETITCFHVIGPVMCLSFMTRQFFMFSGRKTFVNMLKLRGHVHITLA